MNRLIRFASGLALVALAGAVAVPGREGWPWFLAAGTLFLGWSGRN
jgi:hypothetical protein